MPVATRRDAARCDGARRDATGRDATERDETTDKNGVGRRGCTSPCWTARDLLQSLRSGVLPPMAEGSDEKRFDVRVSSAPAMTPQGEAFAAALARAFGIDTATAQRLVSSVPIFVKRGVSSDVAESLRRMLSSLGATVEIIAVEAATKKNAE